MSKEKPVYGSDNPHPLSTRKTELSIKIKGCNIRARIEF